MSTRNLCDTYMYMHIYICTSKHGGPCMCICMHTHTIHSWFSEIANSHLEKCLTHMYIDKLTHAHKHVRACACGGKQGARGPGAPAVSARSSYLHPSSPSTPWTLAASGLLGRFAARLAQVRMCAMFSTSPTTSMPKACLLIPWELCWFLEWRSTPGAWLHPPCSAICSTLQVLRALPVVRGPTQGSCTAPRGSANE